MEELNQTEKEEKCAQGKAANRGFVPPCTFRPTWFPLKDQILSPNDESKAVAD
jgi:hypothetical protein